MAGKKSVGKKTASKITTTEDAVLNQPQGTKKLISKQVLIGALVLVLISIFIFKKHWLVSAVVNNQLVFSPQVLTRLYSDFRQLAVSEIINERLIMQEAKKRNVSVSNEEVKSRIAELESQVGGNEALISILAQEGTGLGSLARRLKMQLILEKVFADEATVSAEEVDDYIKNYKSTLIASDSASQRVEAETVLKQNKLGVLINQKFSEIRNSATIQTY